MKVSAAGERRLELTDVTAASGLAKIATGYGMGVAAGDVDNDGFTDRRSESRRPRPIESEAVRSDEMSDSNGNSTSRQRRGSRTLSGWGRPPAPGVELRSEDLESLTRDVPLTCGLGRSDHDAGWPATGRLAARVGSVSA